MVWRAKSSRFEREPIKGVIRGVDENKLNAIVKQFQQPAALKAFQASPEAYLRKKGLKVPVGARLTLIDYTRGGTSPLNWKTGELDMTLAVQVCGSVCVVVGLSVGYTPDEDKAPPAKPADTSRLM